MTTSIKSVFSQSGLTTIQSFLNDKTNFFTENKNFPKLLTSNNNTKRIDKRNKTIKNDKAKIKYIIFNNFGYINSDENNSNNNNTERVISNKYNSIGKKNQKKKINEKIKMMLGLPLNTKKLIFRNKNNKKNHLFSIDKFNFTKTHYQKNNLFNQNAHKKKGEEYFYINEYFSGRKKNLVNKIIKK